MNEWIMKPIGHIRSSYTDTSQVPKGLGAVHTMDGILEVLPEYEEGLTDIEGFSHLVILWVFHQAGGFELMGKTPIEDKPHGVFATRSPRRPNPIGLTTVELISREGKFLYLHGVDMLDGTPVLDIKPLTSSPSQEKLRRGWLGEAEKRKK
jgi:tRNA (adenine37-N6)-methyltransferase